jgi:acyl transferase domain-containing protein
MKEPENIFAGPSIAVVGITGRFPGARNLTEFWRNLRDGIESISVLGDEQLIAGGVTRAELENPDYVRAAAILDDIDRFDAAFFGLSPRDAAIMDPQHRFFIECAWEALENAGWSVDEFSGRVGVYAGSGMNTYLIHNLLANPELVASAGLFLLKQTGNDKDVLATRVSYQLNLTGPSLAVQTACSTSLVAIHLACQGLLNHECDMALAGGVTIEIPHGLGYLYREGEILSRDGHCRSFDAASSGTIFGSGLGIVVLRRLEDAVRDGDCIHAVIRGTAINNDGARKVSYLAPSVAGQADAIAEALTVADVEADSISYIETHGTGTTVGDPIEIAALTRAFRASTERNGFCAIGSLKASIGHLDAAAGVAGFIKTVLALEHQQIPSSLNFSQPNPLIDFEHSPFYVNTRLRDWESDGKPRRAGVTSLGIGGTNAHAILEEAPCAIASGPSRPWQVVTLSAKTPTALDAMAQNLADHLEDNPANLADVAFTTHLGRKGFRHRRAIICNDSMSAADMLRRGDPRRVVSN